MLMLKKCSPIKDIIYEAIEKVAKPIPMMQKEDKLMIAKIVDEKGGFLIKGAVSQLALARK